MTSRQLSKLDRTRLLAAQRVLQHAVSTPEAPADIIAAQQDGYPGIGLNPRDAAVLANTDHRRIGIYRSLVRFTLREAIELQTPRTIARLGEEAFEHYTRTYFETELPRSQILRDVAYEFAVWACPRWRADKALPPFLADLARYELLEFDVGTARRVVDSSSEEEAHGAELAADEGVAFDGSTRLAHFDYAVHKLPEEADDRSEAEHRSTTLLAYRDADGRFRRMLITPLAGHICKRLMVDGQPLAKAVAQACEICGEPLSQRVIDGTALVLEDLAKRGVALGARRAQGPPPATSPFNNWLLGSLA